MRRDPKIQRGLISMTDAAGILGVSRQRVYQLIDEGTLPAEKVGEAGNLIILLEQTVLEYKALQDHERQQSRQAD